MGGLYLWLWRARLVTKITEKTLKMNLHIDFNKYAGLITIWKDPPKKCDSAWALHLFVKKEFQIWGIEKDWFDGPLIMYGCGPIFLIYRCL